MAMRTYQLYLLGLLILLVGLFAGQMFHEIIGAQEALQPLNDVTYIAYWQSLDKLMHVRMPLISNAILVVFLANLITFRRYKNSWFFWMLFISFVGLVAETIVTVKLQLPINARIQSLNFQTSPVYVASLKAATFTHFVARATLRFVSFLLLIVGSFKLLISRPV